MTVIEHFLILKKFQKNSRKIIFLHSNLQSQIFKVNLKVILNLLKNIK
jgi:hypothetical protein